jgi:hypothetical protein
MTKSPYPEVDSVAISTMSIRKEEYKDEGISAKSITEKSFRDRIE